MYNPKITLTWTDPNILEEGHKVYRSGSPMDINNMPIPLAQLDKDIEIFEDDSVVEGETYYYRVSAYNEFMDHEAYSDEAEVTVMFWNPTILFENGHTGVYYNPRPEYLYQDAQGTIPVVSDGDPVGYMQDLSGNGIHAIQTISASRPTYRTDGVYHWLEFDGIDDYMLLGDNFDPQITGNNGAFDTYFLGKLRNTSSAFCKLGDSNHGDNFRQWTAVRHNNGFYNQVVYYTLSTDSLTLVNSNTSHNAADGVLLRSNFSVQRKASGTTANDASRHAIYVDGVQDSLTVELGRGTLGNIQSSPSQICLGGAYSDNGPIINPSDMDFYGLVFIAGSILNSDEDSKTNEYLTELRNF